MANPKGKSVFHLVIDTTNYDKFRKRYPELLRIFLNKCVYLALNEPEFFEKVFLTQER